MDGNNFFNVNAGFLLDLGPLLGYLNFPPGYFIRLYLEIYSLLLKLNSKNYFPYYMCYFAPHFDIEQRSLTLKKLFPSAVQMKFH